MPHGCPPAPATLAPCRTGQRHPKDLSGLSSRSTSSRAITSSRSVAARAPRLRSSVNVSPAESCSRLIAPPSPSTPHANAIARTFAPHARSFARLRSRAPTSDHGASTTFFRIQRRCAAQRARARAHPTDASLARERNAAAVRATPAEAMIASVADGLVRAVQAQGLVVRDVIFKELKPAPVICVIAAKGSAEQLKIARDEAPASF